MNDNGGNDSNLVPVNGADNVPEVSCWNANSFIAGVMSSLDLSKPEDRLALLEAIQGDSLGSQDVINTVLRVKHMVAHPVDLVDVQTGEVKREVRTILIDVDGTQVAFVSKGVFRSACWLAFAFGKPPWPKGLAVKVAQVAFGDGRRTFKLVPQVQADAQG